MRREFKALPFTLLKSQSSGRTRAGIASVFGNVDAIRDRMMPGSFAKTIAEGAKRARFLWNHSYQHPPVASITELKELTRDELPQEVLDKAPDATGGLMVKREYYDTELSNWILQAIDAGDINEMSFAYDIVRATDVTEPVDGQADQTRTVRNIEEVKLFDCSDVLWGCNPATVADGAKNFELEVMPLGVLASQLSMINAEAKAGRRNAANDQKLIDLIHETAISLGAVCNPEPESDESGKSSAAADDHITAPSPNRLELLKARQRALKLRNSIS